MCLEFNFTPEKCPHMSRNDLGDGQEHPIDILLFSSFGMQQDMRVTNFKTRFLKNGSSDHFGINVPDLGSSSTLLGYKSPSYDFSKKFKVLLGRCDPSFWDPYPHMRVRYPSYQGLLPLISGVTIIKQLVTKCQSHRNSCLSQIRNVSQTLLHVSPKQTCLTNTILVTHSHVNHKFEMLVTHPHVSQK